MIWNIRPKYIRKSIMNNIDSNWNKTKQTRNDKHYRHKENVDNFSLYCGKRWKFNQVYHKELIK